MEIKTCEEYVLNDLATTKEELGLANKKIEELIKERDDLKERLDFFSKYIRQEDVNTFVLDTLKKRVYKKL